MRPFKATSGMKMTFPKHLNSFQNMPTANDRRVTDEKPSEWALRAAIACIVRAHSQPFYRGDNEWEGYCLTSYLICRIVIEVMANLMRKM